MREIRAILGDLGMEVISMREAGFTGEIVEDGVTFAENAAIKARAVWEKTGGIVMADDSGLEIDYLNGEPGVYSARYLGDTPYEVKNRTLIGRLDGVPDEKRTARFVCVIAVVLPDGTLKETRAAMEGRIACEPRERAVSATIPSCICRSTGRPRRRSAWRRRIRSATGGRLWRRQKNFSERGMGRNEYEDIDCQRHPQAGRGASGSHRGPEAA